MLRDTIHLESQYKAIPTLKNFTKATAFLLSIFALVFLADFVGNYFDHMSVSSLLLSTTKWLFLLLIGLAINFQFTSIAILMHEAAHGLFAKTKWLNEFAGNFFSLPIFLPFNAYRFAHFTHHRILRDKGNDPEAGIHLEKSTYERLVIGAFRYSSLLTRNSFKAMRDKNAPAKTRRTGAMDILARTMATLFWYFWMVHFHLSFLYVVVPFLLTTGIIFTLRGTLDHHGLPAAKRVNGKLVLEHEKLSYVTRTNPWMEFFWSNVNYHTVHHMYPSVSWLFLRDIYERTRGEVAYTETQGYIQSTIRLLPKPYYSEEIAPSAPQI